MKQSLSPAIVAGALAGVFILTGVIFFILTRSPAGSQEGVKSQGAGIPPEIAKEIGERMKGARPSQPGTGH